MDVTTLRATAAALGFATLCAGNMALAQRPDAAQIVRDEHAAIRANLCPAPGAPANPANMFDTAAQRMAPAKVFDNLYLLGMKTVTAWALTTSEGIILFDAMFHYNVEETVVGSLRQLGLDPADIKYVIITHAHGDHFGGAAYLQETFGARVVMGVPDWEHMRSWPQRGEPAPFPRDDIAVRDGYTITLGDTTVRIVATPGIRRGRSRRSSPFATATPCTTSATGAPRPSASCRPRASWSTWAPSIASRASTRASTCR